MRAHDDRPAPNPAPSASARLGARRVLSGVKELASFLVAGVVAIVRFWAPARDVPAADDEPALDTEPSESEEKKAKPLSLHDLATKVTPYPAQEG